MHEVHQAMMNYVSSSNRCLPPFRFSSMTEPSLPESGHWGGTCQPGDPALCATGGADAYGSMSVNLWTLVDLNYVDVGKLVCPGAPAGLDDGKASMFQYTPKFSSYCMRFPYSRDLFTAAPAMGNLLRDNVLGVYCMTAGGQDFCLPGPHMGASVAAPRKVPVVRMDRRYRIEREVAEEVAWGDGVYDPASDVMLADCFWWRESPDPDPPMSSTRSWPLSAGWCHRRTFNALSGGGAVRTVQDDSSAKPIESNSSSAVAGTGQGGPDDAVAAERVWQFLDADGDLD
jgi:hypothetical protein